MNNIPSKLQREEFRFVKIQKGKKYPFETNWQDNGNYHYNDHEFEKHIRNGGNYGVVCGYGDLVVIDCDKDKVTKAVRDNLPETFEVETGSGGAHFYYICKDIEKPIRMAEVKQGDLGDVQYTGKQVVGPGSLHPSGNNYKLKNNHKLVEISVEQIRSALKDFIKNEHVEENKDINKKKMESKGYEELDIEKVVDTMGLKNRGNELQGSHPLHGSNTGMNFCINKSKNVWHCFRHDTGGGPLLWIAVKEGIISCSDATHGALDKDKFKETLKVASEEYGLKLKNTLDDELTKELKEKINENRWHWNGDTKFVSFTKEIKLDEEKTIYKYETYELPKDLADKLIDIKVASEKIWFCTECNENFYQKKKPHKCSFCGAKNKKIKPLHPSKPEEIGDVLLDNYHFATIRESMDASKEGRMHVYTGGVYRNNGCKGFIRHKIKMMKHNSKQRDQRDVIQHIATLSDYSIEDFGIEGNKTVVKNGVLDLEKLELSEHDPKYLAVREMDVNYNPDADCPKFKEYLKEDLPDKKDRKRLQEFLGTALVNKKMHKKGMIIVGPTDSGKSTLIKIISAVFGEENVSNQDPHNLVYSRWSTADLRNVMLNATDEVQSSKLKNLALLKKIMDGNKINAERKGENTFRFQPTCEHIFAANQTPSAERSDNAFWNRWLVVEMPNTIPEEKKDEDLSNKILEEKEGILRWIIEGYKDFMDNGKKFTYKQSWEDSRDKWLNWGNSIQRFIQNCVKYDKYSEMTSSELHEKYAQFANKYDMQVEGQKKLTKTMKQVNFANYSENIIKEGRKKRGFKNVTVTELKDRQVDKDSDDIKSDKEKILSLYPNDEQKAYVELESEAQQKGIDPEDFNEWHEKLINDGEIHEPEPGKYKRL